MTRMSRLSTCLLYTSGHGGQREYTSRALHELVIGGDNLLQWADAVGFADTAKAQRLAAALQAYRRSLNRERFTATVAALTPCGEQDVYDVTVADVHAFDANGLVVHNCAEQPLPPYGCCCLGSIDLTRFVRDAFEPTARFDEAAFAKVAQVAVRMLDNVLDTTVWPLPQQQEEASRKRRIGLGFTGLGDALVMLGLRYDETPAREKAARISEVLRDAAYEASADLAKERGAFKLFNADLLLSGNAFASRLPQALREKIRAQGLRNSHLLSIAPTGTISLAFADNASNGIEPAFSWSYTVSYTHLDVYKRQAQGRALTCSRISSCRWTAANSPKRRPTSAWTWPCGWVRASRASWPNPCRPCPAWVHMLPAMPGRPTNTCCAPKPTRWKC